MTMNGDVNHYPPPQKRQEMAEAIVKAFPCLGIDVDGVLSSAHFYNRRLGTGFIEARLKRERGKFDASKRIRYRSPSNKGNQKKKVFNGRKETIRPDYIFNEIECRYMVLPCLNF